MIFEVDEARTEEFAEDHPFWFDAYVELRVRGTSAQIAFKRVFPNDVTLCPQWPRFLEAVEYNQYTQRRINERLNELSASDLWNPKTSLFELIQIAKDPFAKDTARLGAIKELNVMCNIVVVDENGKTRAGKTLADFYASEGVSIDASKVVA